MTREEQIEEVAISRFAGFGDLVFEFIYGANWADENPNWHKYPEEKPPRKGEYVTCDDSGKIEINQWQQASESPNPKWYGKVSLYPPRPIVAWMELPQPPKFD